MSGRPTKCSHGTPLYNSWRDCPECVAEKIDDDRFEETRRQTKILEDIAYRSSIASQEVTKVISKEISVEQQAKAKFIESQEMARFAEERFRMDDLIGAVMLVSKSIELEPSFMSFYHQRARYLAEQGKKDQAITDLRTFFDADPENFVEIENQLKAGRLNQFSSMKLIFEEFIYEIRKHAEIKAREAMKSAELKVAEMRLKFVEKPIPDFINNIEEKFDQLKALAINDSYIALLNLPSTAEKVRTDAISAIMNKDELEKKARRWLLSAEENLQIILCSRGLEFASHDVQKAQNSIDEAKKVLQVPSYNNLMKCIEVCEIAIDATEDSKTAIKTALTQLQQPIPEKLNNIHDPNPWGLWGDYY